MCDCKREKSTTVNIVNKDREDKIKKIENKIKKLQYKLSELKNNK